MAAIQARSKKPRMRTSSKPRAPPVKRVVAAPVSPIARVAAFGPAKGPGAPAVKVAPKGRAGRAAWVAVLVMGLLLGGVAFGMPAIAHGGNHGTIKVHDEMEADPAQRNEPHVDCEDLWIEGFKMSDGSGTIVFYSWPPTGDKTEVGREEWSADAHEHEEGGFHFLAGPFMLEAGHYRVEVFTDEGHPGSQEHFAKAKMFWVEPCESEVETSCPTDLLAVSHEEGGFMLSWTNAEGSDGTNVYRAVEDGEFEFLAFAPMDESTYHDMDVENGVTYTYTVTGLFGNEESTGCEEVTISMIPDFPTAFAMGAATMAAVLGYAFVSRRRN